MVNNLQPGDLKGDILIVDDTPADLELLSLTLTKHGYRVRGAPDGPTALMIAGTEPPDLVLLDIRMQGMDGYEACRQLKANEKTRGIPVIFISALGQATDKVKGFAVGGVDYVTKPFQTEEVLARVQTHLALRNLQSELERRVEERTAELAQTNASLKAEIAERVRAERALRESEQRLRTSLREKEVLLAEIHDRVKNNLQVIISMLSLQAQLIEDKQLLEIFKRSQNRVMSMALVHEKLYRSFDLARVDFENYIRSLARHLFHIYEAGSDTITLTVEAEGIFLGLDTAVSCGLILNELVSNSLQHAFPANLPPVTLALAEAEGTEEAGGRAEIRVEIRSGEDKFTMIVSDSGTGLPEELDFRNTKSLGLQLVTLLTDQLEGEIELDRSHGTTFKITFAERQT